MSSRVRFHAVAPQFTVPDLVRTVSYYRDVLGFQSDGFWDGERVTDGRGKNRPVFAMVNRDDVEIFFNQGDGSEVRTGRVETGYDVYLRVSDVDALATDLQSRGAEILDGPATRSYGQRELVIRDCNGLVLAFGEPTERR